MAQARIYKPNKTAMQSGKAKCRQWVLEFCPEGSFFTDPIMGWRGSTDTRRQVRLTFRSLDSALAYATKMDLSVQVEPPSS